MRRSIADCLKEVMVETGATKVWAGDPNLCHDAYERFAGKRTHPLNRIKSVIDAARRSPMFHQNGYIRACDATGRREVLHPMFVLKS